jgi:hypothetical protein
LKEIPTQQAYDCYVLKRIVEAKVAKEQIFNDFNQLFPFSITQIQESKEKEERALWAAELFLKYFPDLCKNADLNTIEDVALLKLRFDFNSHNEGGRSGCFPLCSYFNHSCLSNCKCVFTETNTMEVKTTSFIKSNSELFISYVYLPDLESDSYENLLERQEYLKKHFLFECRCERCLKLMKTKDKP